MIHKQLAFDHLKAAIDTFCSAHDPEGVRAKGGEWLLDNIELFATERKSDLERARIMLKQAGFHGDATRKLSSLVAEWLEENPDVEEEPEGDSDPEGEDDGEPGTDSEAGTQAALSRFKIHNGRIMALVNDHYEALCSFVARIVADVVEDDGINVSRKLTLRGILATGEPLSEITIEASKYADMGWVVGEWGAKAIIYSGKTTKDRLRHAIQELSAGAGIETRHAYTHTGWRIIGNKRAFLHAGGAVGVDDVTVTPSGAVRDYVLPQPDPAIDPAEAMRASLELITVACDTVSIPVYASMFLAPLSEVLLPDFLLWIEGESGSHKSTLAALCLNHYGPAFSYNHLPVDWASTANRLERDAFIAKDVPLVIDDLKPSVNRYENQKALDAVARLVRSVGNRNGRGRLNSDSTENTTYSPRGLVISTAERGAYGVSTNARMYTVLIEPDDVRMDVVNSILPRKHLLNHAMAGYIQWLAENWDTVTAEANAYFTEIRNDFGKDGGHGRLPSTAGLLAAGLWACTEYAVAVGAITADEAEDYRGRGISALSQRTAEQRETVAAHDPATIFMETVVTLLRQETVQIANVNSDDAPLGGLIGHPYATDAKRIGWYKDDVIYLMPSAYNAVKKFVNDAGHDLGLEERTLRTMLGRRGWLIDGEKKVRVRVPGEQGDNREYVMRIQRVKFLMFAQGLGVTLADLTAAQRRNSEMIVRMSRTHL